MVLKFDERKDIVLEMHKKIGHLENNKHLRKFISGVIGTIRLNKSRPLSRHVKHANWLGKREVLGWMWRP
jgi:hypothetical protein